METTTRLLLPEVIQALRSEPDQLLELAQELHPADLADLVAALEPELAQKWIQNLPTDVSARLLEASDEATRVELFHAMAVKALGDAAQITDEMAPDDRVDMLAELPIELRRKLLAKVAPEEVRDIRKLLAYPEDTAGALLTTEFVALPATTTVGEAIDIVRDSAAEVETIYWLYVIDTHGPLVGVVSMRDLVTSRKTAALGDVMNPNVVSVDVDADQEEVARLIAKYDLMALPVVDPSHRLLGIVTVDDVMDVVEEEATEDVHKLGAVEPLESPYLATPVRELVWARAPWLIVLFMAELFTENVLEHYSSSDFQSVFMVVWFIPVIMSSGGNSGSQSATLVIRAMAVGRIGGRDNVTILLRELFVGLLLGGILAVFGIARIATTEGTRSLAMAGTIGCSLVAVVTFAALIGSGVPLLLRRLRIDPAVSSTPFIASVLDLTGLVIYFEIARLFLP